MPPDPGFVERVVEVLTPAGEISQKAMFGGVGLWEAGDMFALISSDTELYFKVDADTVDRYRQAGANQFHNMPYWSVPAGFFDDPNAFEDWVDEAIEIGHVTAATKREKKSSTKKKKGSS